MLQQAVKLCFHPFEALEGEFGAFFVLHKGCSLVELIYKGSAVGELFSRTRFALFQHLFSGQIGSKTRHMLEKKKDHLFQVGKMVLSLFFVTSGSLNSSFLQKHLESEKATAERLSLPNPWH